MADRWSYFPRKRDLCLIGIEGYPTVVFTLCENHPPFRELRTFPPVSVTRAEVVRTQHIRREIDPLYWPDQRYRSPSPSED